MSCWHFDPNAEGMHRPNEQWHPRPRGAAPHGPGGVPKRWNHVSGLWETMADISEEWEPDNEPGLRQLMGRDGWGDPDVRCHISSGAWEAVTAHEPS